MFGRYLGNTKEIILGGDEKVFAIDYSLFDISLFHWLNLHDTICRLTIKTNYNSYGPYGVPDSGCEKKVESVNVPSYFSLENFFEIYTTTTMNGYFTFTLDMPTTTSISTTVGTILTVIIQSGV